MNEYASINVRLSRTEFERLSATAQRELRHPRDQARYLLRLALGLVEEQETRSRGAVDSDAIRSLAMEEARK